MIAQHLGELNAGELRRLTHQYREREMRRQPFLPPPRHDQELPSRSAPVRLVTTQVSNNKVWCGPSWSDTDWHTLRVSFQPRLRVFLGIAAKVKAGELNLSGRFGELGAGAAEFA